MLESSLLWNTLYLGFIFQTTRDAFVMHHWDTGKNKADNVLINGKGRYVGFRDPESDPEDTGYTYTPTEVINPHCFKDNAIFSTKHFLISQFRKISFLIVLQY